MNKDSHNLRACWRTRQQRSSRVLILLSAVLLHAALLLIPLRREDRPFPRGPLEVEFLVHEPPATAPAPEAQAPGPPPPVAGRRSARAVAGPPPEPGAARPAPREAKLSTDFVITAAFLYDAASRIRRAEPEQAPLLPGIAPRGGRPRNLTDPVIARTHNRFDDLAAPARVEFADSWSGPDGSMLVVMRTPGGHAVCGRGEAWDPFNPLVEHVMLFRTCGGGGPRIKPAP